VSRCRVCQPRATARETGCPFGTWQSGSATCTAECAGPPGSAARPRSAASGRRPMAAALHSSCRHRPRRPHQPPPPLCTPAPKQNEQ
jgi:hypothetical protein